MEDEDSMFNSKMYLDCAQITFHDKSANIHCDFFSFVGSILALLMIPTVALGIIFNCMLFAALYLTIKRSAKLSTISMAFCTMEILYMVQFGIVDGYSTRGLPWLGFTGRFLDVTSEAHCRTVSLCR
ncbi:unnamed protein product, partial [Protopolystoma xenopodis]